MSTCDTYLTHWEAQMACICQRPSSNPPVASADSSPRLATSQDAMTVDKRVLLGASAVRDGCAGHITHLSVDGDVRGS